MKTYNWFAQVNQLYCLLLTRKLSNEIFETFPNIIHLYRKQIYFMCLTIVMEYL